MSNEPERAEPVLSPEDRPPEALFEDYVECALDPQGAAAAVAALRARLDAAAAAGERLIEIAETWERLDIIGPTASETLRGIAAAALGGSDSPTGPGDRS